MPTYQYACTSDGCGLRFERVQSFTDDAISSCPDCSERVRKVYGSVGVVFKGSGFYRNDSRDAKSSGEPVKAESSGSPTKSESSGADKPAADKPKSDSTSATPAAKSSTSDTKKSASVAS
jgi:putative FmdB family regulatory protein